MPLHLKKSFRFIFIVVFFLCFISKGISQDIPVQDRDIPSQGRDIPVQDRFENGYLSRNLSVSEKMSVLEQLIKNSSDVDEVLLYSEELLKIARSVDANKTEIMTLRELAKNSPDVDKAIYYSEELLKIARSVDSTDAELSALRYKGSALTRKGELSTALEVYFEGVETSDNYQNELIKGWLYIDIAEVYSVMENSKATLDYYNKALSLIELRPVKKGIDSLTYAVIIENIGDEYNLNLAQPDSALVYFKRSGELFKLLDDKNGIAYNTGNRGLAYAQLGKTDRAEENITSAIELLEELGDYYGISVYLSFMSEIYLKKGDLNSAFNYAENSLRLAKNYGLKEQIGDAYLKLSEVTERSKDYEKSLAYFKEHISYRDSIINIKGQQDIANQRRIFELELKQNEITLKESEIDGLSQKEKTLKAILIATAIALALIILFAIGLYRRTLFISKTKKLIEIERNRSEDLLLNILPEQTAQELKDFGSVKAKKFDSVSVLFTDFKGFTNYAEDLSPELLVKSIGFYFSEFDNIVDKYGLEKIKTIGDSYMCAGGLPFPSQDHAKQCLRAAMEMNDFVNKVKADVSKDYATFDIRIGLNSGPVIAGVVGRKKIAYDIWGDTVNVASRMESMSDIGRINIGESTYHLVKDDFDCEYRGKFEVKNRGKMKMYFVNSALNDV